MNKRFNSTCSCARAYAVGARLCLPSIFKKKRKVVKHNRLSSELVRFPFPTTEKHYINGEIVDVSYYLPDWWKCFHPNVTDRIFTDAVRGFCIDNTACSFDVATIALRRLPEKKIIGYADFFNRVMDNCNFYWF